MPTRSLPKCFRRAPRHLERPAGPRGAPTALPALLAQPGEGTGSGFPPLPQREGYREVLRRERACAGLDVRERRSRFFAAALSKVPVKCDTPAKREQKKHPSTRPSSSPPPFSMETRKRRRSRVCYGKVSPWSETVFQAFLQDRSCPSRGRGGGRQGDL